MSYPDKSSLLLKLTLLRDDSVALEPPASRSGFWPPNRKDADIVVEATASEVAACRLVMLALADDEGAPNVLQLDKAPNETAGLPAAEVLLKPAKPWNAPPVRDDELWKWKEKIHQRKDWHVYRGKKKRWKRKSYNDTGFRLFLSRARLDRTMFCAKI